MISEDTRKSIEVLKEFRTNELSKILFALIKKRQDLASSGGSYRKTWKNDTIYALKSNLNYWVDLFHSTNKHDAILVSDIEDVLKECLRAFIPKKKD